jgi:DNA-binding NarL/FixJ family response regulator
MTASTEVPLALLWRELTRGNAVLVDGFFHGDRCYLLVAKRAQQGPPLEGKRLEILEAVLAGQRQKNIAIDRGLAPSTVALNSRLGLEALGVSHRPSRAHPLLMLAARASALQLAASAKCTTILSDHNRELRVVSVPRPDLALADVLPTAELSVIRSLVEGNCYLDIARARGTSTRTIANQISMVFRRLRVSGRNELVQRLFVDGALGHASKPSPEPPPPPPGLAMRKSA